MSSIPVLQRPTTAATEATLAIDGQRVPARVVATADGATDLAAVVPAHQRVDRAPAVLEWVEEDGVCRVAGSVAGLGAGVVRFSPAGPVELVQRRAFLRVDHVCAITVVPLEREAVAMRCRTRNLSAGGLLVDGLRGIGVGERIRFSLVLEPGSPLIAGTARIVRETSDGGAGLHFARLGLADRDRLVAFAYAKRLAE